MTDISSAGSGDWHTAATWTGGAVPGTGDKATIVAGHTVTISTDVAAIHKIAVDGTLAINANITFDDGLVEPYIQVRNGGVVTSNATDNAPHYLRSAGGVNPTNKWYFSITSDAGAPAREINLEYIIMSGNWWFLGISAIVGGYIHFNLSTSKMMQPSPIVRDQAFNEHLIDGRAMSRIYPRGGAAGRTTVKGYFSITDLRWKLLEDLKTKGRRLGLTTSNVHMPQARIESLSWGAPKGAYIPFSMTLVEDV